MTTDSTRLTKSTESAESTRLIENNSATVTTPTAATSAVTASAAAATSALTSAPSAPLSTPAPSKPVFYRQQDAWVGDVIPYAEDGEFFLYFLRERREEPRTGMGWALVSTSDGVEFHEQPRGFDNGGAADEDFNAYTGSIVKDRNGVHHLFYTGQNPRLISPDGRPYQRVMHASSRDNRKTWTKHPEDTFTAPPGYEPGDWRDPFVFADPETGLWRMLIAARHDSGPQRRRGTIAQATSSDLKTWKVIEPFWDPRRYIAHECPEVFEWNGWWYLVYSEFSENFTTRYRKSRSLNGPWLTPQFDTLDGRAYYAAKSASLNGRRHFFGWIPTHENNNDDGAWQWAGTLSVLEARQLEDGNLGFQIPPELLESFSQRYDAGLPAGTIGSPDGYSWVIGAQQPEQFRLRLTFDFAPGTTELGLLLNASEDGDHAQVLRLEPKRSRMVFDRWPRAKTGEEQWQISGDVPFLVELERPCTLEPGEHVLEMIYDRGLCVFNLDATYSLSTRIDNPRGDFLGIFAGEGEMNVHSIEAWTRGENLGAAGSQIEPGQPDKTVNDKTVSVEEISFREGAQDVRNV